MQASGSKISIRKELPVLLALFLDLAAFGMVFPDVQLHARSLGASGQIIGLLLASMFVVQMIASPPWGVLSDRIGRRPVFVFCTVLSATSWIVYAISTNLTLILVSRILAGLAAANVVVAQAYLSDVTPDEGRSAALGRAGAAISGGLILGPALGMWIATYGGVRLLGEVAACCSAAGALLGLFLVSSQPRGEAKKRGWAGFDLSLFREHPALRSLFVLASVAWFALATLEGTFGRLVTEHFKYPPTVFGEIFSMESLLGAIVQGLLLGWVVSRVHERWTLRLGFFLSGIGLLLTPFAPAVWVLFLVSGIYSIGTGLANPTLNSAASRMVDESRQGELFGMLQGSRSVGFLVGPVLGGTLFDWRPESPYILAGAVGILAAILSPSIKREATAT